MDENKKPGGDQISPAVKTQEESTSRPLPERPVNTSSTTPSDNESDHEDEYIERFDDTRIPPNLSFSPYLDILNHQHSLNIAWYQDFHTEFCTQVAVHAEGAIAGLPAAVPYIEGYEDVHPLFVIYIEEVDISHDFVSKMESTVRNLVRRHYTQNPEIPIRFYEWNFGFLGVQFISKPALKSPQPCYQHSLESRMGHSVSVRGSPNPGTIFGFVSLFDKKTGVREHGHYAVIPSHVATSLEHSMSLKEGDSMLQKLHSPGFEDHVNEVRRLGKERFFLERRLAQEVLKEPRSSEIKIASLKDLITNQEDAQDEVDGFNTGFGKVLYGSGVCLRPFDDGIQGQTLMDLALVKLDHHRTGINQLANEAGARWPQTDPWNNLVTGVKFGQDTISPHTDWRAEIIDKLPTIKYGRSSRVTEGEVQPIRIQINQDGMTYWAYGIWSKKSSGDQPFSDAGDSGAPVISVDGKAMGMLIAGNRKRIKEGFGKASGEKYYEERDVAVFLRWIDIKEELEKNTKWRVEWFDGEATPPLK